MTDVPKTVGYGNPPLNSRFKAGKSGNPSGRPKGSRNLATDLRDELGDLVVLKGTTITKQRAIVKSVVANAIAGDAKAIGILFSHFLKNEDVDHSVESAEDREIAAAFATRSMKSNQAQGPRHE